MKKSLLAHALNIARTKLPRHPQYAYYPHYSFVVQDNKIIEWSCNSSKHPPIHYGYIHRVKDDTFVPKSHSEIEAYRCARSLLNHSKPFELINIRLNKKGEIRNSKPCKCCYSLLTILGCSKFYYSSDIGFLVT